MSTQKVTPDWWLSRLLTIFIVGSGTWGIAAVVTTALYFERLQGNTGEWELVVFFATMGGLAGAAFAAIRPHIDFHWSWLMVAVVGGLLGAAWLGAMTAWQWSPGDRYQPTRVDAAFGGLAFGAALGLIPAAAAAPVAEVLLWLWKRRNSK